MLRDLAFEDPRPAAPSGPVPPAPEAPGERAGRIATYRVLSGAFAEEPGAAFLAALRDPGMLEALAEAGVRFDADFLEPAPEALAEALACEYTTLFAASGGFPPVESVRLTGRYKQEPLYQVQEEYRRAGFALAPGRFFVFDDQIGVELAFAAALLERATEALEGGDGAASRRLERDLKRFWTLHLGRWARGYARLVERAAEHSFYREMGRLLGAFAAAEIARLAIRVDDLDQGREVVPKSEVKVAFDPDEPVCNACGGAS